MVRLFWSGIAFLGVNDRVLVAWGPGSWATNQGGYDAFMSSIFRLKRPYARSPATAGRGKPLAYLSSLESQGGTYEISRAHHDHGSGGVTRHS